MVYINKNLLFEEDLVTVINNNIKIYINNDLFNILIKNKGKKIKKSKLSVSKETFNLLLKYEIISFDRDFICLETPKCQFFNTDYEVLQTELLSNSKKIGLIGVPFYYGELNYKFSETSLEKLREKSLQYLSPNRTIFFREKKKIKQSNIIVNDLGDIKKEEKEKMIANLINTSKKIFKSNIFPIYIGGDHSISYPIISGLIENNEKINILYLDAHSDLGNSEEKLRNGNVFNKINKINENINVINFGIRGAILEKEFEELNKIEYFTELKELKSYLQSQTKVPLYLSIDLDVFNNLVIPSVTYSIPGGISIKEFEDLFIFLLNQKIKLLGIDITEYNAFYDYSDMGASNVVYILYLIIKYIAR